MKRNFRLRRILMKKHILRYSSRASLCLGLFYEQLFTTLPTVLSDIAAGLGVDVDSLGLLTSLPLLTFAISHLLRFNLLKSWGLSASFFLVLIAITIGSAIRLSTSPSSIWDHLDWSWHRLPQCAASNLIPGGQTPPTRHSDHLVYHFYGGCLQRSPLL